MVNIRPSDRALEQATRYTEELRHLKDEVVAAVLALRESRGAHVTSDVLASYEAYRDAFAHAADVCIASIGTPKSRVGIRALRRHHGFLIASARQLLECQMRFERLALLKGPLIGTVGELTAISYSAIRCVVAELNERVIYPYKDKNEGERAVRIATPPVYFVGSQSGFDFALQLPTSIGGAIVTPDLYFQDPTRFTPDEIVAGLCRYQRLEELCLPSSCIASIRYLPLVGHELMHRAFFLLGPYLRCNQKEEPEYRKTLFSMLTPDGICVAKALRRLAGALLVLHRQSYGDTIDEQGADFLQMMGVRAASHALEFACDVDQGYARRRIDE